jgi:phospholipid/cholesterol/gamma-HCH transport system substrate-binding protein
MMNRTVFFKLAVFVVISALGIGYLLVNYVGIGATIFGEQYTAYLDLPDSGGIFTTASVTYRGVEVGRVGTITLRPGGIQVALNLKSSPKIPSNVRAVVADGSAIGEQYVDLRPHTDSPPYLHSGSVIMGSKSSLPVNSQQVLVSVDRLVNSVPTKKLRDVVDQLGTAFNGTGPALQRLLDASHTLLASAQNDLPKTIGLLNHGGTVLDTQNALRGDILSFSRHLASFTTTLRGSNHDLRRLLANGPPAATQLNSALRSVDTSLPIMLNNLVSVGQVTAVRIPAIRQILVIYPYVVATSYGLFPDNGTTRFGVPVPPSPAGGPCTKGYVPKAQQRLPTQLKYPKLRYNAFCKEPTASGVDPRGSREAPEPNGKRLGQTKSYQDNAGLPGGAPGDSATTLATVTPDGVAFTAPNGQHYVLGSTGGEERVLGDQAWKYLLFGPMS